MKVYADWWYAWCLLYFIGPSGVHRHIFITLKKSLQWVPLAGWVRIDRVARRLFSLLT